MSDLKTDNYYLPIRLSHLLRHCAVGAVVRTPNYLLVVKDTNYWIDKYKNPSGREILYVEQVKQAMGIQKKLREPPIASIDEQGKVKGSWLPAQIFPSWYVCKSCRILARNPYKNASDAQKKSGNFVCSFDNCGGRLEQITLVQVHSNGSLNDVPWHYLAHDGKNSSCQAPLKWFQKDGKVICLGCSKSAKAYAGMTFPFKGYSQPWINSHNKQHYQKIPENKAVAMIMEVNDTRVHTAVNKLALVIPPESRIKRGSVLDRLYHDEQLKTELLDIFTNKTCNPSLRQKSQIKRAMQTLSCTQEEMELALQEIKKGYPLYHKSIQSGGLLEDEYKALSYPLDDVGDDEDFVTNHLTKAWREFCAQSNHRLQKIAKVIDKVVAVSRLKEIVVLEGFSRGGVLPSPDDKPEIIPPDIVGESDWLPALELYGEGIFISLNEEVLSRWENNTYVLQRKETLHKRLEATNLADTLPNDMSARFLLLHTLSHLLIKELESQAGYPAASLKEKIYSAASYDSPMAGILIYVAIPDISGSLGGLCELAEPRRLVRLLVRIFEKAEWCSLDPVCKTHTGQGPALLNLAACHACLLVPETSCCCGNILLDRMLVKGERNLPSILDV